MTGDAALAHDLVRWVHFKTQEKPLLAAMTLGALDSRERAAVRARVRRLWRRETERRCVMRSLRVAPTRRESCSALARLAS